MKDNRFSVGTQIAWLHNSSTAGNGEPRYYRQGEIISKGKNGVLAVREFSGKLVFVSPDFVNIVVG